MSIWIALFEKNISFAFTIVINISHSLAVRCVLVYRATNVVPYNLCWRRKKKKKSNVNWYERVERLHMCLYLLRAMPVLYSVDKHSMRMRLNVNELYGCTNFVVVALKIFFFCCVFTMVRIWTSNRKENNFFVCSRYYFVFYLSIVLLWFDFYKWDLLVYMYEVYLCVMFLCTLVFSSFNGIEIYFYFGRRASCFISPILFTSSPWFIVSFIAMNFRRILFFFFSFTLAHEEVRLNKLNDAGFLFEQENGFRVDLN